MLYRFLAATIIVFWLTMAVMLVRREIGIGNTSLREVPVAHVAKMMLGHEQASDLQIYNEKVAVGRVQIHPRIRKEDGQRRFDLSGTLQIAMPGMARQRLSWTGELDLGKQLEMERLKVAVILRDPPSYTVDLLLEPAEHRLTVETRTSHQLMKRSQYSLDEKGANDWLRDQGIDPSLLMSLHNPHSAPLVIRALQSSLEIRGEKVETYLISAEQGEQTLFEAHVSELGQILRVRTFVGYSAAPDDLIP
ncbi:MAG: hypothetical protein WCF18_13425 [Chthoniobacteraceae bacterium]